jgi:hypothetical protein
MRRILLILALSGIAVSAGAQTGRPAPPVQPNPLGVQGFSGVQVETKGRVTHLTRSAVIWFSNGIRLHAEEATINFDTNRIELKGSAVMSASVR